MAIAGRRRRRFGAALDTAFFIVAGVASVWLAYLILEQGFTAGWAQVWFYLLFWIVLAYIALPRLHRILTNVYVPDYFIGRARTSDGLLGDPINLALLGGEGNIHEAMLAAGWVRADPVSLRSGMRIVASTITRRSYIEAPVSPLMLFGRNQDFAYQQEVKGSPSRRHHVRFWRCPDEWMLPGGHAVDWLAAGTYDRSVGLSLFTLQVTHKIAEDTDGERDHIVASITSAVGTADVTVLRNFASGYHARNGGGDSIVTDGDLPVVDLRAMPVGPTAEAQVDVAVPTPRRRRPGTPEKPTTRPSPTTFGGIVVLLRAVTPLLAVAGALLNWPAWQGVFLLDDGGSPQWTRQELVAELPDYLISAGFVLVWSGVLGVLVLRGSNVARVLVMLSAVSSIVITAISHHTQGLEITLSTNLVALSLDILILTALSSSRSRDYAHRAASGNEKGPEGGAPGPSLPDLDSNQEPAG